MQFEDRVYQTEAAEAGASFLLDGSQKNGLIVLPTGAGKSRVIAMIAQLLNAPLLVFNPSKEILEQNLEKFHSYGYQPSVYSASMGRKVVSDLTLATIGSVAGNKKRLSRADLFQDFPYVIVDECHLTSAKGGQYKSFFDEIEARLLGLTATPYRMATNSYGTELRWLTRTRPRIWHEVLYYAQISDLFAEGYLAKLEYQVVKGFNKDRLKVNSSGAEYTDESVQKHLFEIGFDQKLEKVVRRLLEVGRKSILVFTRFVQEAERLAAALAGAVVTAKTPKAQREAVLRDFKSGRIQVVANVNCLAVGFDYPELDTVVDAAPTMSLARYYQKLGRGIRPHPDKESCWIVDMVGGCEQFGKIEQLTIHEDPWRIMSGDRALTNCYLTSSGKQKCKYCESSNFFWGRHKDTNRALQISHPVNGVLPNISLVKSGGKTVYEIVKPGTGEFVAHQAQCVGRRR